MNDEDFTRETARAAILAEYQYVSSLIPLYRGFEMQAMRLAILILTATAVFIAAAIEVHDIDNVLLALAFVPGLMAGILLAIAGMEVRIIRASRYIELTLTPEMRELAGRNVFMFEQGPGVHLTKRQVMMTSTSVYTTILLVSGTCAGAAAAWIRTSIFSTPKTVVAVVGLVMLWVSALLMHKTSAAHESRRRGAASAS